MEAHDFLSRLLRATRTDEPWVNTDFDAAVTFLLEKCGHAQSHIRNNDRLAQVVSQLHEINTINQHNNLQPAGDVSKLRSHFIFDRISSDVANAQHYLADNTFARRISEQVHKLKLQLTEEYKLQLVTKRDTLKASLAHNAVTSKIELDFEAYVRNVKLNSDMPGYTMQFLDEECFVINMHRADIPIHMRGEYMDAPIDIDVLQALHPHCSAKLKDGSENLEGYDSTAPSTQQDESLYVAHGFNLEMVQKYHADMHWYKVINNNENYDTVKGDLLFKKAVVKKVVNVVFQRLQDKTRQSSLQIAAADRQQLRKQANAHRQRAPQTRD
jgi:hypothetical protein